MLLPSIREASLCNEQWWMQDSWLLTLLKTRNTCVVSPRQDVCFSFFFIIAFLLYAYVSWCICGAQRETYRSWFQVSNLGHMAWQQHLYPLSHLGGSKEGPYNPHPRKQSKGQQIGNRVVKMLSPRQDPAIANRNSQTLWLSALVPNKGGLVNNQSRMGEGIIEVYPYLMN